MPPRQGSNDGFGVPMPDSMIRELLAGLRPDTVTNFVACPECPPSGQGTIRDLFPDLIEIVGPARFVPRTPCWEWRGNVGVRGYGWLRFKKATWQAHRLSYWFKIGKTQLPTMVCHTCDNKLCVNPEHLFAGNARVNAADRIKWKAQLSLDEIRAIRESIEPSRVLARKWQLSSRQIERIRPTLKRIANRRK